MKPNANEKLLLSTLISGINIETSWEYLETTDILKCFKDEKNSYHLLEYDGVVSIAMFPAE